MGWSSGSRLAEELIEVIKDVFTNHEEREEFYEKMIPIFEDFDCDTLDECIGTDSAFDSVWESMYPSDKELYWNEDDEE